MPRRRNIVPDSPCTVTVTWPPPEVGTGGGRHSNAPSNLKITRRGAMLPGASESFDLLRKPSGLRKPPPDPPVRGSSAWGRRAHGALAPSRGGLDLGEDFGAWVGLNAADA